MTFLLDPRNMEWIKLMIVTDMVVVLYHCDEVWAEHDKIIDIPSTIQSHYCKVAEWRKKNKYHIV